MEEEQGGFTLIELVISLAILAVLSLAIGSFLYISIRQYQGATVQVELQTQAQMVQNQMENLIFSTTQGIYIPEDNGMYQGATEISLFSKMDEEFEKIVFTRDGDNILYSRYLLQRNQGEGASPGWQWSVLEDSDGEIFAEAVKDFSVELCDADGAVLEVGQGALEAAMVKVTISYELNQKSYTSKFQVSPRNQVIVSDNLQELFDLAE